MPRRMEANSFRWHNSSYLPAVAIYNEIPSMNSSTATKSLRRNKRDSSRRMRRLNLASNMSDPLLQDDEGDSMPLVHSRVKSASPHYSVAKPEWLELYASPHRVCPLSRHASAPGLAFNQVRRDRTPIWDRLSVPRHVTRRSADEALGEAVPVEDKMSGPAMFKPTRAQYLYGLPLIRPAIKVFSPFLKHNRWKVVEDRAAGSKLPQLEDRSAVTRPPTDSPGIHVQVPVVGHVNSFLRQNSFRQ